MAYNLTNQSINQYTNNEIKPIGAEKVLYALFMAVLMAASVVGNFSVVMAVLFSRSLKKRVTFYFIASLACSDFLFATFQLPFRISSILNNNKFIHDLPACYVMIISDAIVNVASILNLLLIALDRFIAIKYPFRYVELMTSTNSKRLIVGVWCIAVFWSFIGIFNWEKNGSMFGINVEVACSNVNKYYYAVSSFGLYMPVLIFITCTYLTILHVALQQIRAIEKNQVVQVGLLSTQSCQQSPSAHSATRTQKRRKKKLNRELRATKSVVIVYLAYVVCWLPFHVINVILLVDKTYFFWLHDNNFHLFLFLYYTFIEILPAVNAMVNPFIYSFSNKQFKDAFKSLLSKTLGLKFTINRHDDFMHSIDLSTSPASPALSVRGHAI